MKKRSVYFLVIAIIMIAAVMAATLAYSQPPVIEPKQNTGAVLEVDQSGSTINANVPGGQLQQGAAPENSGASSEQTPQQAQPNYCTGGEVPVVDGCVSR